MEYSDTFITDKLRWERVRKNWIELENRTGVKCTDRELWLHETTTDLFLALLDKIESK